MNQNLSRLFLPFALALGAGWGCGGGGGSASSTSGQEQTLDAGSFSVRTAGTVQEPVTVTGIGATAIGIGGSISRIQWMDLSESTTRDDIAYLSSAPEGGRVDLYVSTLDQRSTGLVERDVVEGMTAWSADGSRIYVMKRDSGVVKVGTVPAYGGSGFTALTSFKTSTRRFAVSADERFMAFVVASIGTTNNSELILLDRTTLTAKTLASNKLIDGVAFFGPFSTLAAVVSDDGSRFSLKQFNNGGTLLSSVLLDTRMQSLAVTTVNGLQQLVALRAGNSTTGDVGIGSLSTPNTFSPILSFIFPDGSISVARGVNRFLVSQSASFNRPSLSGIGTATMTRLEHINGGSASMFSRANAAVEVSGSGNGALLPLGGTSAQGTIITSAAAPTGMQTFGSAIVFGSSAGTVKVAASSSNVGGAQMVLSASAADGAALTSAKFVNSLFGGPKTVAVTEGTTQLLVILDSRTGAVTNLIAIGGRSKSAPLRIGGEKIPIQGSVLAAWDGEGQACSLE